MTNLIDRPDSGITDTWALDTFTRTVKICVVATSAAAPGAKATSTYHAIVTDSGTFKTLAAHSPQAGTPLAANIPGTFSGGFTADFTAAADFTDYNGKLDGKTFTGDVGGDNPSTGNWIATLFDGGLLSGSGLNNDWSWTYKTCAEQWVNANSGNTGDITGLPTCVPGCLTGWYVNPDETTLLPTQQPDGLLFDGPSIVHHQIIPPIALSALTPGTFVADVATGVPPLFKVETLNPYSTLNYVGDGTTNLWWSSKIAYGNPGGQGAPIAAADFIGKWNYTGQTVVYSFGVGYANDKGNKATVKSITFGGKTYDLSCRPPTTTTTTTTTTPAAPQLPVTGASLTGLLIGAAVIVVAGAILMLIGRRRRT